MLINPINFRLSISLFWNSTWSLYKNNIYKYLFYSDLVFFEFFMFFFRKIINLKSLDYYPSHIRLYRLNSKIIINLYYHTSKEDYYDEKIDLAYANLQKKNIKKKKEKKKLENKKTFNFLTNKLQAFIKIKLLRILFNSLIWKRKIDNYSSFFQLKWKNLKKQIISIFGLKFWLNKKILIKKYYTNIVKTCIIFLNNKLNSKNIIKLYNKKVNNSKNKIVILKNILFTLETLYKKKTKKKRVKYIFYKMKYNYLKKNIYGQLYNTNREILKINWKNKNQIENFNDFYFIYKINLLKFYYNQKLWIFNLYYYFLSKYFKKINNKFFKIYLKKLELNILKINKNMLKSNIVSKYITTSFKNNYNVYETIRPILVDLKQHIIRKRILGFKITISGRFKRAQRATYWWRKDGHLYTGTQTAGIDYSTSLHKTKYGACTINVWLTYDLRGFGQLKQEYPSFYPFFFLIKKHKVNYFILKKNSLFFSNLLKKGQLVYYNIKNNYIKGLILNLIYKYLYTYIFSKNIIIKKNLNNINKNLKRFFLPQYCLYKIFLEDILTNNFIKIIPFIHLKLLKRINLRNSYKIKIFKLNKLKNLKIFKYKIYLT